VNACLPGDIDEAGGSSHPLQLLLGG
jgi:hypothetical protein